MTPKKNPGADLEKKSTLFFMIGIALSLLFVLMVFEYRQAYVIKKLPDYTTVIDDGPKIPITVTTPKEEKTFADNHSTEETNVEPEVDIDFPKLDLTGATTVEGGDPEEGVVDIPMEPEEPIETVEFVLIEKMARPLKCQELNNLDDQKECFNYWIQEYLGRNVKYPETALRFRLEDKVYVTFVISEHGEVESAEVAMGEYDVLNEEALRVINDMPTFVPGSQRGKPVKMKITIPVNFKLSR